MNIEIYKSCSEKFGTPFYIFDEKTLTEWVDCVKSAFSEGISLCYAIKANPFLMPYMDKIIDRFEVCSPGEYEICLKYGIASEKIVLSGVYKSRENIERAFDNDFNGVITLESPNHFRLLKEVIAKKGISHVKILPRLSSGNKFGMSKDDIIAILTEIKTLPGFEFAGLQFFSGTQKKRMNVIERELKEIDAFCDEIHEKTGLVTRVIEYGPGIFYDYYNKCEHIYIAHTINELLKPYTGKYKFILETGRYLSASCGHYVTKIVDIKKTDDTGYCIVDGGIHHVNYFGRMLGINVPDVTHIKTDMSGDECVSSWEVCGALCTVNDVLLRNHPLNNPKEGDILVFNDAGAYSCTEAGVLFLSRTMPKILALLADGNIKLLRDSIETYEFNC